jgi:hypothetical protein
MKNIFKSLFGKKETLVEEKQPKQQKTNVSVSQPKAQEKQKHSISVKVASEMGNSIYAEFYGYSDDAIEKRIIEHFVQTDYLESDEIPTQFQMCKVYFHKKIDIHEAAAIMSAEQKAEPSANTRIDDSGSIMYYDTDVKNCQTKGRISWPGGSIKITRILMPSVEDGKYHLVIINS